MKVAHNGLLLRIFVAAGRRRRHADVFHEIVDALAAAGIAGATAFRGIAGHGSYRQAGGEPALDPLSGVPILIEAVDDESKVRAFLPTLDAILEDGLVALERVQTLFYRAGNVIAPSAADATVAAYLANTPRV